LTTYPQPLLPIFFKFGEKQKDREHIDTIMR